MESASRNINYMERIQWCNSVGAEWYQADINEAYRINQEIDSERTARKHDKKKLLELVRRIEFVNTPRCKSKEGQSAVRWVQNTLAALAGDLDDAVRSW